MSYTPPFVAAVRQNALTSQLMGVDFIPVCHARVPIAVAEPSTSTPIPEAEVEPKPVFGARGMAASEGSAAVVPARASVAGVDSLDDRRVTNTAGLQRVRERYDTDCPHQHFVTAHTNIVFGEGDPCARLVFVGEAPGADEDASGRPFVGKAGQLLNKMIGAMGLAREQVYITNVLKTRPPNNATPTIEEARLCAPYLFEQLAIIRPEVIVTLGLPATRLLLGTDQTMGALRGRWSEFAWQDVRIPVMPTYHPAFLLRSYTKENREKVWSDLQKVMERLGLAAGKALASE